MIREYPPECFRFGNYKAAIPFSIDIDNNRLYNWLKTMNIVGYSYTPEYKSLEDYPAIMLSLGGKEYWSHIPKSVLKRLLNSKKEF